MAQQEPQSGDLVYVRLKGRLGHVVGLSQNLQPVGTDEDVYTVRMADDGSFVDAGASSLGDPSELDAPGPAAELEEATPEETPAEAPAAAEE